MSFSSDVKNELANVENRACCRTQQARAMLLFGRECSPLAFSLLTENEAAARAFLAFLQSDAAMEVFQSVGFAPAP